jgi:hypothetical protein
MEKAVFRGKSEPQFLGKRYADTIKFGTIGKIMYDFLIVVNGILGSIVHG